MPTSFNPYFPSATCCKDDLDEKYGLLKFLLSLSRELSDKSRHPLGVKTEQHAQNR